MRISDWSSDVCSSDLPPAFRELAERLLDQSRRALRPRIEIGPGERARKTRMGIKAQSPARLGGEVELLDRPFLPLGRLAPHRVGRESVELGVIGGMHRKQLALQMRRKLGDLDARLAEGARKFIAIILDLGGLAQTDADEAASQIR